MAEEVPDAWIRAWRWIKAVSLVSSGYREVAVTLEGQFWSALVLNPRRSSVPTLLIIIKL